MGIKVIVPCLDKVIRVWDIEEGKMLYEMRGHLKSVSCANFNQDQSLIVSASYDRTIRLWDANTGKQVRIFNGHEHVTTYASFSPDSSEVVSSSWDNTIRIWDTYTGLLKLCIPGHSQETYSACYDSDGSNIVSSSYDRTFRVWDPRTGKKIKTYTGHTRGVTFACFSPNGDILYSSSKDGTIKAWDKESGDLIRSINNKMDDVGVLSVSECGRMIAASKEDDCTVRVWCTNTGELLYLLKAHSEWVNGIFFTGGVNKIVTTSWDGAVVVWDLLDGKMLAAYHHDMKQASLNAKLYSMIPPAKETIKEVMDAIDKKIRTAEKDLSKEVMVMGEAKSRDVSKDIVCASGAVRNNGGKVRIELVPSSFIKATAEVFTWGALKYDDRNWERGFPYSVPYSSLMRHLLAWFDGEDLDPESGLNHLKHAACNLAMLIDFVEKGKGEDDRSK